MTIDLVAWDFDGVLNRNIVAGRFAWAEGFEADTGHSRDAFEEYVFLSGRFHEVLLGRRDLLDLIGEWCAVAGCDWPARKLMDYWFEHDRFTDPFVLELVRLAPARSVIATNNDAHRARFIAERMDVGKLVAHVFAAGPMGVAKPDPGFFGQIAAWSGLPPERMLLVDDTAANIAAASALGWRTFHFTDETRHDLRGVLGL